MSFARSLFMTYWMDNLLCFFSSLKQTLPVRINHIICLLDNIPLCQYLINNTVDLGITDEYV
jgi:hypothetical protein